jgi:hypothetical protein
MKISSFEAAALGLAKIKVNKLNADLTEQSAEYTLCLDMNAHAKVLEHTGKDLTDPKAWQNLTAKEVVTICWCAFDRFYPEITLREVGQMLSPAQSGAVFTMLLELCFPGILERMEKAQGESQPNAQETA